MGVFRVASADISIPFESVWRVDALGPVYWYKSFLDRAAVKGAIRANTRASGPSRALQRAVAPRAILSDCLNATVRLGHDVSSCRPLIAFARRCSATSATVRRCSEHMKLHARFPHWFIHNFMTSLRSPALAPLIGSNVRNRGYLSNVNSSASLLPALSLLVPTSANRSCHAMTT